VATPPVLELAEQAIDEIAPAVFRTIMPDGRATIALSGDAASTPAAVPEKL